MSYNIWLWSMALLVYMLDRPTWGSTSLIEAVPGQNVSLPCIVVDQVNDQQAVKWYSINAYISSGKEISLGVLNAFYAIPGEDTDYSLFIMIPDDMDIWEHFIETYECRLVSSSIDGDFSIIETYQLQIYQPVSTSLIPPQETEASSPSTSPTLHLITENSPGTVHSTTTKHATPSKMSAIPETSEIASIMTTAIPEGTAISSTMKTTIQEGIGIHLIVIMSVAAAIILFLIILLIYFVRRNYKVKQNTPSKSPTTDGNIYFEIDLKEHDKPVSMMGRPAQYDDITYNQSTEDNVMEENSIYQSVDTNDNEQKRIIDRDNVARQTSSHEKEIQPDEASYLDNTNKAYEEIDDIIDVNNMNKESGGLQTSNEVETTDDLGHLEHENEAYESIDEVNVGNTGIVREGSGRTSTMEQNDMKPAYVHYEVLQRE